MPSVIRTEMLPSDGAGEPAAAPAERTAVMAGALGALAALGAVLAVAAVAAGRFCAC